MDVDEQRTFKQLTVTNWSTPDPVMRMFSLIPETGLPRPATAKDWAGSFLELELSPAVPRNIRDLFEVARGIGLYGWFFYPLYQQLAEIQMTKEEADALQREGDRLDWLLKASDKSVRSFVEPPVRYSPMDQANKTDLREAYDTASPAKGAAAQLTAAVVV